MSSTVPPDRTDLRDVITSVPAWLRVGIAVAGALVLSIGAVAVFRTTNGNGSAALVAAGLALIVLAVLTERLQSIEAAGLKLQLSTAMAEAEAESTEKAADHADDAGRPDEAERLRAQADALRRTAQITGAAYEGLRARRRPGPDRTDAVHRLLSDATRDISGVDPQSLRELFSSGSDGTRVLSLHLMQDHPEDADADVISEAILRSRSAMEQWHALRAAEKYVSARGDEDGARAIRQAVRTGLTAGLVRPEHQDRYAMAQRILHGDAGARPEGTA